MFSWKIVELMREKEDSEILFWKSKRPKTVNGSKELKSDFARIMCIAASTYTSLCRRRLFISTQGLENKCSCMFCHKRLVVLESHPTDDSKYIIYLYEIDDHGYPVKLTFWRNPIYAVSSFNKEIKEGADVDFTPDATLVGSSPLLPLYYGPSKDSVGLNTNCG